MPVTRQITDIALIGNACPEICGNQLPSNKQVLQCYFYYKRYVVPNLTKRKAATLAIRKCAVFWEYAGISMVKECNAIDKLEKLVNQYRDIFKYSSSRKVAYPTATKWEIEFRCKLEDLFDIAHQKQVDAMTNEKNKSVKTLLDLHREKGRNGRLDRIIDTGTWVVCSARGEDEKIEEVKQVEPTGITANYTNYVYDDDEDIEELVKQIKDSDYEDEDSDYEVRSRPAKPKKLRILTPNLTAVLDRAKVSNRMGARVIAAILMILGISSDDVHLSPETLRRNREKQRESMADQIKDNFKQKASPPIAVHWDGKQMSAPEDKFKKIDRLPVLVSGHDWNQLLGIPRLEKGSGQSQAEAIYDCLKKWDVIDDICAMVFDTTASNTGSKTGACFLLEKLLGRELLYLACRHHIFELLLKIAFESSMESTSGPEVSIFKRFQGSWKDIGREKFTPGVHDDIVKESLHCYAVDALAFAEGQLKKQNIRNDYREFLELIVMFLGENLTRGNRFRALGPMHHARWMSKAIYSLKIFLFRKQFTLSAYETSGLRDVCIFIVLLYQRAWFMCSNAVAAPNNDWKLLRELSTDEDVGGCISSKIRNAVFDKFSNHLWYLSEELIAFAFFDVNVSTDVKRKMCQSIESRSPLNDGREIRKRGIKDQEMINDLSLDSFVTQNTMKFFKILKIDSSFLDSDPTTWNERDDFSAALKAVSSLNVTNDIAERSVALMSEYNDLLTKNETSKQHVMSIVKKMREISSECTKESMAASVEKFLNNESANLV